MTHTARITVSPDRSATLPQSVLDELHAQPGDTLLVQVETVPPSPAGRHGLERMRGILPHHGPTKTDEEIQAAIEEGWAGQR